MNLHSLAALSLLAFLPQPTGGGDDVKITPDVVYGRKHGMALTLDVIRPAKPTGAGVLWIQSGGWYSNWNDPKRLLPASKPLLDKGFTIFIVRHGSAPKYTIPEIVDDVRLSVRFVRLKAKEFGVDPERLGAMGGSAGGHLALVLATTGDDGNPAAKDAVARQSSRVAAVVALFPPTDLRGWTTNPPDAIKKLPGLKPPLTFDAAREKDVSPVLHVTAKTAPVLLIHGDKDALVPIEHSRNMIAALKKGKATGELVVVEGAPHSFTPRQNQTQVLPAMLRWFDRHLAAKPER